jgi:hypothetical protein
MRIRDPDGKKSDPGWKNIGSGINTPDPQHCPKLSVYYSVCVCLGYLMDSKTWAGMLGVVGLCTLCIGTMTTYHETLFNSLCFVCRQRTWPRPLRSSPGYPATPTSSTRYRFLLTQQKLIRPVAGVLDEPYSQLTPLSRVAVQARQFT